MLYNFCGYVRMDNTKIISLRMERQGFINKADEAEYIELYRDTQPGQNCAETVKTAEVIRTTGRYVYSWSNGKRTYCIPL